MKPEMIPASVSVVIPCFNAEETILRALESVQAQTMPIMEIICVDDCSSDHTLQLIEEFKARASSPRMQLLRTLRNSGPSLGRNLGWDAAAGDFVAFLDADDAWYPDKIAIQSGWMREHTQIDLCGHAHTIDAPDYTAGPMSTKTTIKALGIAPEEIILSNPFVTPSVMVKRALKFRFEPTRRYTEDYLLWMQICLNGHPVAMLDVPLVSVSKDRGKEKLSRNYFKMRMGDIENYWQLWREQKISFFKMCLLIPFSLLKFFLLITFPDAHSAIKRRLFTKPLQENSR